MLCAVVELALVVGGSWAYFRAASSVAAAHGGARSRATAAFAAVLVSGLVTLGLSLAGF